MTGHLKTAFLCCHAYEKKVQWTFFALEECLLSGELLSDQINKMFQPVLAF